MKNVRLLITDLDDTIWDWLSMWHNSFKPYFERIKTECGIKESDLISDFKNLHRKYHTSEVSYAYKELRHLAPVHFNKFEHNETNPKNILREYYGNKNANLDMYMGVLETLQSIKAKGTRIIGFTESNIFYTKYRIKMLELDGIFDVIYSPEAHDVPETVTPYYDKSYWQLEKTTLVELDHKFKKPNKAILQKILLDNKINIDEAIYIGDKLDRDIYMANQLSLTSVHAAYGHIIDTDAYELLKKVTHWTDEEVKREIEFKDGMKGISIQPTYSISNYSELLSLINFSTYKNGE